jgi:hypothetical protein
MGIDSSAALAIIKLRNNLTNNGVQLTIFVAGSYDGFPCEINLSEQLNSQPTVNGDNDQRLLAKLSGSMVCEDLDSALACAEVSIRGSALQLRLHCTYRSLTI